MSSISDIFSPTFLIFLGILVLVVSLLVVYFESKLRDQNHKFASMLSLVSALAEDVNGVKFGLNRLAINSMGGRPLEESTKSFNLQEQNNLITVSDDEESDNDDEEESDEDDNENYDLELDLEENNELELEENSDNDDSINDSDDDSDNENIEDVKVLKINITTANECVTSENDLHDVDDLDELDDDFSDRELEVNLDNSETLEEFKTDLKTININLEETQNESMDYKKLPLPKLRTIVSEKGLASDPSKLKKNELLKLLESE